MTTKGDMVDYNTERQRLGIGSANQILQVKSSLPSWETVPLADTVLTTAGDVLYENATPELARLPKGNLNDVLTMGASLPAWSAPAGGGGSYVFLESFTATASSTFTCTLSSPIALADFSRLVGVFRGKYGAGALELQLSNNLAQPLTASHYVWSSNVLSSTGATAVHGSGVDHFELVNSTTDAGARGLNVFEVIVLPTQGDGGGLPSDMMWDWQWAGERTSISGGGYTYNNTGNITHINGFFLTNSLGNNFEVNSVLEVYKVQKS